MTSDVELCFRSQVHLLQGEELAAIFDAVSFELIYVHKGAVPWLSAFSRPVLYSCWLETIPAEARASACDILQVLREMQLVIIKAPEPEDRLMKVRNMLNPKTIRVLDIIPTFACNLACSYCYQHREAGTEVNWNHRFLEVDEGAELLRAFLDQLPEDGRSAEVVFIGGEPLVHPELLRKLIPLIRSHVKGGIVEIVVVTNGTLIDDSMARLFADHHVFVIVSVDGPPEINDTARLKHGGKGSFKEVMEGYQHLVRHNCRIGVSLTVEKHNVDNLGEKVRWIIEHLRPSDLSLNSCLHGLPGQTIPFRVDPEVFAAQFCNLYEGFAMERSIPVQLQRRFEPFLRRKPVLHYCPACTEKIVVTPDGKSCSCEGFAYLGMGLRAWREALGDQLSPDRRYWATLSPLVMNECQQCPLLLLCGGGCRYDAFTFDGSLDQLDTYRCNLDRALFRWFMLDFLPRACDIDINTPGDFSVLGEGQRARILALTRFDGGEVAWR